ncbi:MAG: rhodanese-like domain-containing protein [Alcanivoracaceae bacterium]|nr:rhodanese-like domain-containing protein [Alcanivoracaceae bacterium]
MKTISLNDLLDRLRSPTPPALIEALPPRHFMQGHLPGALNINVGEVKALAPELLPTKAAGVVVYCASASCTNSDQVAVQLLALGYTDVAVFKGGQGRMARSRLCAGRACPIIAAGDGVLAIGRQSRNQMF